jgi:hypothetical protein
MRSIDGGTGQPGSRSGGIAGKSSTGPLASTSTGADRKTFVAGDAATTIADDKMGRELKWLAAEGDALRHFPRWAWGCGCCGALCPLWGWAVPMTAAIPVAPPPAPVSIDIPLATVGDPSDPS